MLKVTRLIPTSLQALTDLDARSLGRSNVEEVREGLLTIYPHLREDAPLHLVRFLVLHASP